MIRVTVEILPFGLPENSRVLATLVIKNNLTGTLASGNYTYLIHDDQTGEDYRGIVSGFERQKLTALELLKRILSKTNFTPLPELPKDASPARITERGFP